MIAGNRDVLLTAIAKARAWIADLAAGRAASFAEIAKGEGKVERHIRLLAPLAFVSPQLVSGIIDGHAPSVAVTALAKHLSWSWAQQRTNVSDCSSAKKESSLSSLSGLIAVNLKRQSTFDVQGLFQHTRPLAHYLGHRNLQSTARYTALAEGRFAQFWKD
jgi:hypothetical protein